MVAFSSLRISELAFAASLLVSSTFAAPSNYTSDFDLNVSEFGISARQSGQNSFAGTSNYFVAAMDDAKRSQYLKDLAGMGAKVVRLWVTETGGSQKGSSGLQNVPPFESTIGQYNNQILTMLDKVLVEMHANNLKAIISPHDGNSFGQNSCDAYCKKYNYNNIQPQGGKESQISKNFYESAQAAQEYDARVAAILNHVNPTFNKPWSQLSEVIMAFDIQNEPMSQSVSYAATNPNGAAGQWFCDRAKNFKKYLSDDIAVATGGVGGSVWAESNKNGINYQFINWADYILQCPQIDIISIHGYVSDASNWDEVIDSVSPAAANAGKLFMIEEWGVAPQGCAPNPHQDFPTQVGEINKRQVPWVYWEIVPDYLKTCDFEISLAGGQDNQGPNMIKAVTQAGQQAIKSGLEGFSKYLVLTPGSGTPTPQPQPTTVPQPQPTSSSCDWGCLGWSCQTYDDCDGTMTCNNGKCGPENDN